LPLLLGLVALVLGGWLIRSYIKADPTLLARYGRKAGGLAAIAVAILLGLKGRIDIAIPLIALGVWLIGYRIPIWPWYVPDQPFPTESLGTVEIFPGLSGKPEGRLKEGSYAGVLFSSLGPEALLAIARDLKQRDPSGYRLFQTYLDRVLPGWREAVEGHAHAGQGAQRGSSAMTEQEAYDVLGLQMGASEHEIREAHRTLMKKLHPDQGGTTYLATRVNMAKDVLLNSHR